MTQNTSETNEALAVDFSKNFAIARREQARAVASAFEALFRRIFRR
ncbi:MAG: hypothetical protein AAF493_21365 [Pseudomonadota bacterium]